MRGHFFTVQKVVARPDMVATLNQVVDAAVVFAFQESVDVTFEFEGKKYLIEGAVVADEARKRILAQH